MPDNSLNPSLFASLESEILPSGADRLIRCAWLAHQTRPTDPALPADQLIGRTLLAPLFELVAQEATNHPWATVLRAIYLGTEVGVRFALCELLQGERAVVDTRPAAVAAAIAVGILRRQTPSQLQDLAARAWGTAPVLDNTTPTSQAILATVQAAQAALSDTAPLGELPKLPAGIQDGIGRTLFLHTLALPRYACPEPGRVIIEGVEEVLQRHVKAADKRLRADQLERLEIRCSPAAVVWENALARNLSQKNLSPAQYPCSIKHSIALLIAWHSLGPDAYEALQGPRKDELEEMIQHVLSRIDLQVDWKLTLQGLAEQWEHAHPLPSLLGGGPRMMHSLNTLVQQAGLPRPADVFSLLQGHPERALQALLGRKTTLNDFDSAAFRYVHPVQIKLYTTRGGWWPERRRQPTGTGPDLESAALSRSHDPIKASNLLKNPPSTIKAWLEQTASLRPLSTP